MIDAHTSTDDIRSLISSAYRSGGHVRGWSYIYGPLSSRVAPQIVTIGLNPGGGREGDIDCELDDHLSQDDNDPSVRNSYFDQPWGGGKNYTPLQVQIQRLRSRNFPDVNPSNFLSFQFIPFRSPTWNELPAGSQNAAIELGTHLLNWTLGLMSNPRLVIGFGLGAVEHPLLDWFKADLTERVPTGWGKTCARIYSTPRAQRLVLLPHLSRYQIIGRPAFVGEQQVFGFGENAVG